MTQPTEQFAAAKAQVQTELSQAHAELDAAIDAMAKMPESRERRGAVTTANAKLAEIRSTIASLDAAAVQAEAKVRAADRAGRVERRKAHRQQIREMAPNVDNAAAALIKHIEHLGPLLQAYAAVASDYSDLCIGLAREAEVHLRSGLQHNTEQLLRATDPTRGYLPEAVSTAFWNVGLGRVGPYLEIVGLAPQPGAVEFQADPVGAYLKHAKDLRRHVNEALDRTDQIIAERDARAS